MADTPSPPPGGPYSEEPQPAAPPPTGYEPPPPAPPPAPMPAAPFAPPTGYEPPPIPPAPPPGPPPAAPFAPPIGYEPPPAPPTAASYPPPQSHYAPPNQPGPPGQPYPPVAPPGWAQPPTQKKSHRTLWITLATIFGVLALGVGSCTVWFVGTVKAPVDESNRFLAAIDTGDYAAAAARTDPGCNAGMSAAALDEIFAGTDISYNLTSSSITNSSATVSGSFSAQGRNFGLIELSLRKQGEWRVCGFQVT